MLAFSSSTSAGVPAFVVRHVALMDAVVVVQPDRDVPLGPLLPDDVLVQLGDDVARRLVEVRQQASRASARLVSFCSHVGALLGLLHLLLQVHARS